MLLSILLLNQEILLVNCIFSSRLLVCNNVSVTVGMLVERSIEIARVKPGQGIVHIRENNLAIIYIMYTIKIDKHMYVTISV